MRKKKNNIEKNNKITLMGSLQAKRHTFPNGLKVIFVERKIAPVFSYQTWYNVGSRDEDPGFSGMAHLFEHMMFKGTKQRKPGVFDRLMESNGARDLNAFTSTDYTAYVQSLPIEAFSLVCKLESERMTSLNLEKKSFESEREVVHNERKEHQENNPEGKMYEELSKTAFTKHPYGWPVIGFAADLDRMTTKDLHSFYKKFYAPNNATIVVVGNLKFEKVIQEIKKNYGKIPASNLEASRFIPPQEPQQNQERVVELDLNLQVEKSYLAYKIPNANHEDQLPLAILSSILSSGRSSYLYRAIIDAGLGIEVSAGQDQRKDPSLFFIVTSAHAGKSVKACIQAIDREIENIAQGKFSEKDIIKAKNKIKVDFYQAFNSNSLIANFIGHAETVLGDFSLELDAFQKVQSIQKSDIQRVAKKYLQKNSRTIVVGKPKGIEAA